MNVSCRPATCADQPLLLAMMADFNLIEGIEWSAEACAAPLGDPELGFIEIAEVGTGPGDRAESGERLGPSPAGAQSTSPKNAPQMSIARLVT